MFTSNKPRQLIFSALSVLMLAQGSKASGAIYRPTDVCGLIMAVYDIDISTTPGPSIIDLGGGVFEFDYDCVAQIAASACSLPTGTSPEQVCYQNGTFGPPNGSAQFGLSALPEIYSDMSIVNGRILRAVQIDGVPNPNYFRLISILGTPIQGNLSLFKITLENGYAEDVSAGVSLMLFPPTDANNYGGAIYDAGNLVIQASRIANNYAYSSGGGIFVAGCTGGGCVPGNVDIQTSILSNNMANAADSTTGGDGGGGGIFVDASSGGSLSGS